MKTTSGWILAIAGIVFSAGASAQERLGEVRLTGSDGNGRVSFLGDDIRIGIGIDDDGDVHGEYFHAFGEDQDSTWIGELWAAEDRGGVKLNYHWLNGADDFDSAVGRDGVSIGKFFLAVDQNEFDDRKFTTGIGLENQRLFWGAYVMANLTGQRLVDETIVTDSEIMRFISGGQVFEQLQITENITRVFAHPYDYGVGGRIGKFFEDPLIRIRGGLDFEQGASDADQITVSLGLEKYFANTGHSLALTAEYLEKSGRFEIDDSDTRALLFYRYSFGERYGPRQDVLERRVTGARDDTEPRTRLEKRPVQNRIEITDEAYFDFDRANIRSDAASVLGQVAATMREQEIVGDILVEGHTCNIGTVPYNQGLSERRAQSAVNYLIDQGINRDQLTWRAHGELDPKYSNATEETRRLNRRVEIEFVSMESGVEEVEVTVVEDESGRVEWTREPITDPAWMQRALRNPIQHKRIVDTYRTVETERRVTDNPPVVVNNLPVANDDQATTDFETPVTINVLANDSDPDGDPLEVVSVTMPSNGTVFINSDGTVTYTPANGFSGTDQFAYTITDPDGDEASATVTVTVLEEVIIPVVANDDTVETEQDTPVDIAVLANDSGEGLEITALGDPANGMVSLSGDRVTYTPDEGFSGTDTFSYTITGDNGQTDEATVTVIVNPAVVDENNPPVARDDSASTPKGVPVRIDVLANDSDPDGDPLTIIDFDRHTEFADIVLTNDNQLLYMPHPGWFGGDSFTYTISDGRGGEDTATVTISVAGS